MSLRSQSPSRKMSIFNKALRFQEAAAGVVVQRVPGSYLRRILKPLLEAEERGERVEDPLEYCPDPHDPLVHGIYSMNTVFADCKQKKVDMLSSAESIAKEFEIHGAKGYACLLLMWKTTFDAQARRLRDPVLVGAATLHKFKRTPTFSTNGASLSPQDDNTLNAYFRRNLLYIDAMCSTSAGVGRLLVLHAYRYALTKKCTGLISLSYSFRSKAKPESKKIFEALEFQPIIPRASFQVRNMYGTWFYKGMDPVSFAGVLEKGIALCTRTGFTANTAETLVWRCPN